MKNQQKIFFHLYKKYIIGGFIILGLIISFMLYYKTNLKLDLPEISDTPSEINTVSVSMSSINISNNADYETDYDYIYMANGEIISDTSIGLKYNTHHNWIIATKTDIINQHIPGLYLDIVTMSSATFYNLSDTNYNGIVVFSEKTSFKSASDYLKHYKTLLEKDKNVKFEFGKDFLHTKKLNDYKIASLLTRYTANSNTHFQQYITTIYKGKAITFACYFPDTDGLSRLLSIIRSFSFN